MTKKEAKEKRVSDILDAAVDVFIEKGYESTSMDAIAAKAGISKGGLYHHFLSKDMVFLYATQKLLEPCEEFMKQALECASAIEGLRFYIRTYLEYWVERKREMTFFTLSMVKAMSTRDIFKIYEKFTEDYIRSFECLFKKGVELGEFIPHETRDGAVALMSAMDGVLIYMMLDRKIKMESVVQTLEAKFIDTVRAQR